MDLPDRSELSKALFQQRLDVLLAQFRVTDAELCQYILPRVPANLLFDLDVMRREIKRFSAEMKRVR
jgi:hypothetical protein